jgi:hypothetical protein
MSTSSRKSRPETNARTSNPAVFKAKDKERRIIASSSTI